jgi:hypothetical protein
VLAPFGIGLAVYVMIGALIDPIERIGLFRVPLATALARARGLPRSAWGTAVAHFAAGMLLFGVIAESQWNAERIVSLKPGESVSVRGYDLTLDGMVPRRGRTIASWSRASRCAGRRVIDVLEPSKRTFPQRSMSTTEAALLTRGASQLYLSLGDVRTDGAIAVRLYHKPLVLLIWFGCVVMVLGGALSLSDRRLRVGAPKPARKPRCSRRSRSMRARSLALLRLRCSRARASRCSPTKSCKDPALEAARARAQPGAALHGVPEPVDRRFRRAARQGSARAGARAADRGRQRHQVIDFWSRAMASSCCSSRGSACTRCSCGSRRSPP